MWQQHVRPLPGLRCVRACACQQHSLRHLTASYGSLPHVHLHLHLPGVAYLPLRRSRLSLRAGTATRAFQQHSCEASASISISTKHCCLLQYAIPHTRTYRHPHPHLQLPFTLPCTPAVGARLGPYVASVCCVYFRMLRRACAHKMDAHACFYVSVRLRACVETSTRFPFGFSIFRLPFTVMCVPSTLFNGSSALKHSKTQPRLRLEELYL